ncbi:MAG: metal-sensitive transcriptional regulator [Firmicutes bacterium]|nr:metal-sensitive transcriptional regulator [Bacillota bacterium]
MPVNHPLRDKEDLLDRLKKIEGQVRGLQRMIEDNRYCVDILVQIAAVRAAVNRVGLSVLESHTRGCVADAIREDKGDEAVDELVDVLVKFIK